MRLSGKTLCRAARLLPAFALALGAACAMSRAPVTDTDGEEATVTVENRAYVDMTIYALEGGADRRRLGVASPVGAVTFTIPASIVGQGREVQFVADPIGGTRSSVSRRIFVRPGDAVRLVIPPS